MGLKLTYRYLLAQMVADSGLNASCRGRAEMYYAVLGLASDGLASDGSLCHWILSIW
jgi:hypothetical protein